VLITEVPHLPEPHRSGFRDTQRRYLDRWRGVLAPAAPRPAAAHARVRLQAALTLTNDVARTPPAHRLSAAAVTAIGHAILGPPPSRDSGVDSDPAGQPTRATHGGRREVPDAREDPAGG
jgi:hypothetical protein